MKKWVFGWNLTEWQCMNKPPAWKWKHYDKSRATLSTRMTPNKPVHSMEKKNKKTQRIRTSRFFSHSSVARNLVGVREERRVSVWGIERVFLSNSFWAIWCRTFFTRLILRVGNKPWNQLSLHMLRGRGKTHRQTWLSSQIMFVSFRLHRLSSFCASHLARSLTFPLPTHASRGTRPRASLQATPPTLPPPKKNKKQKDISHQRSSRQLCPPFPPPAPLCFRHYGATRGEISHWFPILLPPLHLSGSQWRAFLKEIWFPTFVHLSFLREPRKIALIPFHTRESPETCATPLPRRGNLFLSIAASKSPPGWHGNAASHLHIG